MKGLKRSEELTEHIDALTDFREAFDALHKALTGSWNRGDPTIAALRQLVGELSGPASLAATEAQVTLSVHESPLRGGAIYHINAVEGWASALDSKFPLRATNVLESCDQAIGKLEAMRTRWERIEKTPLGWLAMKVAKFTSFPKLVREVANVEIDSTAGRVTTGVAVAFQTILIGVMIAILSAFVLQILGLS